ncbi:MAG TPA: P-loop NTPase, partial [Pirellulaceae bacterium]|nr:P-loop NTPase [Pirellulaceae bacterium]
MTTPDQLHSLLRRTLLKPLTSMTSQAAHDRRSSPRLCVLLSGRHGVGTTSLAVNLAVALADQGARVVLVDADVRRAQVARLCGVSSQAGIDDIQHARRDIHEVLVRGPAGLLLLPSSPSPGSHPPDVDESKAHLRLIRQLRSLDRHADIVLLDLGFGPSAAMRRYWESADDVVLVTTPDAPAVLDTYATVKGLFAGAAAPPLRLL